MPRSMTTNAATIITSSYVRLAVFAELHFVSSVEYVWTGRGSISWNGQTWKGVGSLGSVSTITEDSTLTAQGLTVSLSSIASDLLSEALTEVQQGLPFRMWLVFFDESGNPVDSITSYAGRMDQPTLDESPDDNNLVSIAIENRLSDLQRAPFRRLTDQDQRSRYPNDSGLAYTNYLQDWNGSWGSGSANNQ